MNKEELDYLHPEDELKRTIDETINAVCNQIQKQSNGAMIGSSDLAELIKALAELITAREKLTREF